MQINPKEADALFRNRTSGTERPRCASQSLSRGGILEPDDQDYRRALATVSHRTPANSRRDCWLRVWAAKATPRIPCKILPCPDRPGLPLRFLQALAAALKPTPACCRTLRRDPHPHPRRAFATW